MQMRFQKWNPGILVGLLLAPAALQATSFYPQPFPENVQGAPIIVRGKVGSSSVDWGKSPEGVKRVYTYYELQTTEVIKGEVKGTSLMMREMGGEKDGVGLHIPGTSHYTRGEDVVVFLKEKNSEDSYDVQGMMMGKYGVETDSEGKEYLTGPGLIEGNTPQTENGPSQPTPPRKWTLDSLRQIVQTQGSQSESLGPDASPNAAARQSDPSPVTGPIDPTNAGPTVPASQLQSTSEENSRVKGFSFGLGLLVLCGVAGAVALYRILRRKT